MAKTFAVVKGVACYSHRLKKTVYVDVDIEVDVDGIGHWYAARVLANKSGKTEQLGGLVIVTCRNVREDTQ